MCNINLPKIGSLYNAYACNNIVHLRSMNLSLYLIAYWKLFVGMVSICHYRAVSSFFKTCCYSSTPDLSSFWIANDGAKHRMMALNDGAKHRMMALNDGAKHLMKSDFFLEIFQNSRQQWRHFPYHVALLVLSIAIIEKRIKCHDTSDKLWCVDTALNLLRIFRLSIYSMSY